jgi:two-component system nitrogen regulation response regulator GlnG/two-component system response regulator HydG
VTNETTIPERADTTGSHQTPRTALVLVVAWCAEEPWRIGEVLLGPPSGPPIWFGRGPSLPNEPLKAPLGQQRPGHWLPSQPLGLPSLSRYQLLVETTGETLRLRNEGRCPLLVNDREGSEAEVAVGDLVQLGKQLLFICARRALGHVPAGTPAMDFAFGGPDRHGIVGESQAIWELRAQIAALAAREGHVLITGQSGSGKELVAQALHASSARAGRPLVARNAATLPESLIDAELFGNARNYPNPGMPERSGLIGEAHRSTLFLDELAELPQEAQAHLLRVLDKGEYQRLGESQARLSDFRLIAATNRPTSAFKHDLLARLAFRIAVPDLEARRDDIPLLVRHILQTTNVPAGATEEPAVPLKVMRGLLRYPFTAGMRELRLLLWRALSGGGDPAALSVPATPGEAAPAPRPSNSMPSVEEVQRCLDENNGVLEQTWRALGLKNRFVLLRLVKRYDLEVRRRPGRR